MAIVIASTYHKVDYYNCSFEITLKLHSKGHMYEELYILTVKTKQIPKTNDIFDEDCADDTRY